MLTAKRSSSGVKGPGERPAQAVAVQRLRIGVGELRAHGQHGARREPERLDHAACAPSATIRTRAPRAGAARPPAPEVRGRAGSARRRPPRRAADARARSATSTTCDEQAVLRIEDQRRSFVDALCHDVVGRPRERSAFNSGCGAPRESGSGYRGRADAARRRLARAVSAGRERRERARGARRGRPRDRGRRRAAAALSARWRPAARRSRGGRRAGGADREAAQARFRSAARPAGRPAARVRLRFAAEPRARTAIRSAPRPRAGARPRAALRPAPRGARRAEHRGSGALRRPVGARPPRRRPPHRERARAARRVRRPAASRRWPRPPVDRSSRSRCPTSTGFR